MPEPPSIHRNSSRICNLTKRYFSRPTTFSSVFFLVWRDPGNASHGNFGGCLPVLACRVCWLATSARAKESPTELWSRQVSPTELWSRQVTGTISWQIFFNYRGERWCQDEQGDPHHCLYSRAFWDAQNLYLYLYICIMTIYAKNIKISHGILCHWTFLLGHRSNLHCHSSPEQETIPPFLHLQSPPLKLSPPTGFQVGGLYDIVEYWALVKINGGAERF